MAKVDPREPTQTLSPPWSRAFAIGLGALSLILSLGSYTPEDPSFSSFSSDWASPKNVLGYLGSWSADILFQIFGWSAWAIPLLLVVALLRWLGGGERNSSPILGVRWSVALVLSVVSSTLLFELIRTDTGVMAFPPQGLLGIGLGAATRPLLGKVGSFLLILTMVWALVLVWWENLPQVFGKWAIRVIESASQKYKFLQTDKFSWKLKVPELFKNLKKSRPTQSAPAVPPETIQNEDPDSNETLEPFSSTEPLIREHSDKDSNLNTNRKNLVKRKPAPQQPLHWSLPPINLLEAPKRKIKGPSKDQLLETAKKITASLKSFEVEGEITEISPGPIITMYEFQPAPGVRVQKIISTSTDLAMALGVGSVRIVAPIPGKSVAGIEVPNSDKEDIVLRDVFESTIDRARTMRLPLVLGKDGEGRPICEDLSRMPHLLIGGATSMGKSVLVNSLLTGLLCRFTPENLRLIIVDPKLVEFKIFEDIPHLLLPIVNDASDASQALKWAVSETKRRYMLMQKLSAKNLEAYNQKISELPEGESAEVFPYIVIIIDELAELMFTAKRDVEQSIVRLTQLARAAGLHLVMATQRPSADVVTGLIKSNCPSRAALRVASSSDSRIILDCTGAEQLLGRGDMFFTNTGPMGLRRIQSCFVSDEEIEKVCQHWREQGEPAYKDEILAPDLDENGTSPLDNNDLDSLYGEVLNFAKEKGKISTSLIQRRFQIGYSRAARIMEQMEARGIVGEQTTAGKPREVLAGC